MVQTIILRGETQKKIAKLLIDAAGVDYVVRVSAPARNEDQNAKMWAMLSDVSRAKPEGRRWTPETWKCAFMHSLGHQVQFCEGLDDSGPFPMGFKSSSLNRRQMADLITVIYEYGDRHAVKWTDPMNRYEDLKK